MPTPVRAVSGRVLGEAVWTAAVAGATVGLFWLCIGRNPNLAFRDDFQSYFVPSFLEIGRSWLRGEAPLLSAHSWFGGALAAEYAPGALSPATGIVAMLIVMLRLPLASAANLMVATFLAVLAAGVFRLLRVRDTRPEWAGALTLSASLNGFAVAWAATNWFSLLMAFPWLVWFWWAAERPYRSPRRRVLLLALFGYLIVVAGAPWVLLMALLVSGFLVARSPGIERWREAATLCVAWLIAIGLGAVAPLMLREYFAETLRAIWHGGGSGWTPPLRSLVGMVLPTYRTTWATFDFPLPHTSVEMLGALVPVVLIAGGLLLATRRFVSRAFWELTLLACVTILLLGPGFGPFRWSFRWLLFWHLVSSLVAGKSLAALEDVPPRPGVSNWLRQPAVVGLVMILAAWYMTTRSAADPVATKAMASATLVLLLAWILLRVTAPRLERWFLGAAVASNLWVGYAVIPITESVPAWDPRQWQVPDPSLSPRRRYLAIFTHADIVSGWGTALPVGIGESLWPGNTPMVQEYGFVNGYSPMEPMGLGVLLSLRMQGFMHEERARELLTEEASPQGLLEQLGVDGLVLAPRFASLTGALENSGWRRRGEGQALVFERAETLPHVFAAERAIVAGGVRGLLLALRSRPTDIPALGIIAPVPEGHWAVQRFAGAELEILRESATEVDVRTEVPASGASALVVFRRAWYPGYRATIDGRDVPVVRASLVLPAVALPPGAHGTLRLRYRPRALGQGLWSAVITLLAVAASSLMLGRRRHVEEEGSE